MVARIDRTSETGFETLFDDAFLRDLTKYLGLDPDVAEAEQPVKVTDLVRECIADLEDHQTRIILPKEVILQLPREAVCAQDKRLYLPYGDTASVAVTYRDTNDAWVVLDSSVYTLFRGDPPYLHSKNWLSDTTVVDLDPDYDLPLTVVYTPGYTAKAEIPRSTFSAIKTWCYWKLEVRTGEDMEIPDAYSHLARQAAIDSVRARRWV